MKRVVLMPTGNEISLGTVIDTNSPALMELVLEKYPQACVQRIPPLSDELQKIKQAIAAYQAWDLIILIGGSGGGKKYDPDLAADMSHLALDSVLQDKFEKSIYGCNGHLWSRLLIGRLSEGGIIANVPGPYVEAVAAGRALIAAIAAGQALPVVLEKVAAAVFAQYPSGGEIL